MRRVAETCPFVTGRDLAAGYLQTMISGDVNNPASTGELRLPALKIWPDPYRVALSGGIAVFGYTVPDGVSLCWETTDGKTSANPSPQMKADDPASVKRLKNLVPQLERTLHAHIRWIERLYLSGTSFRFDEWRERYLAHETRGALCPGLIWLARTADGGRFSFMPSRDGFVDASGNAVDPSDCEISLWHPLDEPETVDAWRAVLVEKAISQPFAQAFRSTRWAEDFDAALHVFADARIMIGWPTELGALAESYGWVLSSKPNRNNKNGIRLHIFDPVSRLYVATSVSPKSLGGYVT
jgi:hypothetical protein